MKIESAGRLAKVLVVITLIAAAGCARGATILRSGGDEFAKLAGTQLDQLKPLADDLDALGVEARAGLDATADSANVAFDDVLEVTCNEVFLDAVESGSLPTESDLIAALVDEGIPENPAVEAARSIVAASQTAAAGGEEERFFAFVGVVCDVQGLEP